MSLSGVRRFSTKLLRTPEEIKAAIERAQRFKKFNQPTGNSLSFARANRLTGDFS